MSIRHYSYEMIQVSNHSTRQVDRQKGVEAMLLQRFKFFFFFLKVCFGIKCYFQ